jgi:hypothetical protein
MDIGISEEVVQAALVFFARKTSNGHYFGPGKRSYETTLADR